MATLTKKQQDELRALGIDPDDIIKPADAENTTAAKEMNSLAADMTLRSLKIIPLQKVRKACAYCAKSFLTDYVSVGYCSDTCRAYGLEHYGLDWRNKTARERWGKDAYYQPPGIVPPEALEAMARVLKLAGYSVETPIIETISEPATQKARLLHSEKLELSPAKVSLEDLKLDDRIHEEHLTTQKLNDIPQEKPSALHFELDDLFL